MSNKDGRVIGRAKHSWWIVLRDIRYMHYSIRIVLNLVLCRHQSHHIRYHHCLTLYADPPRVLPMIPWADGQGNCLLYEASPEIS